MRVGSIITVKYTLIVATCIALLLVVLLSTGGAAFLAKDGAIDQRARGAVIVYWALTCMILVVVGSVRKRPKETALMVISLLAALGVAEFVLRAFRLFPGHTMLPAYGLRSSRYHHVLPPNRVMSTGPIGDTYYIITTNEDGLRTSHSLDEFRQKGIRIAVFGDSFTFGIGVGDDKTFPSVLEHVLREKFQQKSIGVLNAGLTSYSPLLEKTMYLGKVRTYNPQIVILMLDATDIGDDIIYRRERSRFGDSLFFARDDPDTVQYLGAIAQLLKKPLMYPLVFLPKMQEGEQKISSRRRNYNYYEFDLDIGGTHETNRFFIYRHPLDTTRRYFESTFATIKQLADSVQADGASFIVFVSPRYHHWNPKECPDDLQRPKYTVNEPFQFEYFKFFDSMKDSANFPIVNLLLAFQATKRFPLVFREDAHWNEEGHRFVAEELAEYLVANGYVTK